MRCRQAAIQRVEAVPEMSTPVEKRAGDKMHLNGLLKACLVAALSATFAAGALAGDKLKEVLDKGQLTVGVKSDIPPWGMRESDGKIGGFEIEVVDEFARRLSQKYGKKIAVNLVPVVASNRMEFLQQGRTDMMIATMSDMPERHKIVGIIYPGYYASGVAVYAFPSAHISGWSTIRGKKICAIQGAWYNKDYGVKNGADVIAFKGVPEVGAALLDGRCSGWLYDTAFVPKWASEPEKWKGLTIATPVEQVIPWVAAVRLEDKDTAFGKELSDTLIDMHKSGRFLELEKKYNVEPSAWLARMADDCRKGAPACASNVKPQ
jgi:polar amino acid transport system substrate-binding protein